jgi:cell division protein FtsL
MKTLAVLLALTLLLVLVWERVDLVQVGYRVERLKAKKLALERQRDELRVKVSTLMAPERIARVAADKLRMVPPQQGQVRLVRLEHESPRKPTPVTLEIRLAKSEIVRTAP